MTHWRVRQALHRLGCFIDRLTWWPLVTRRKLRRMLNEERRMYANAESELIARHRLELSRMNEEFRPILEKLQRFHIERRAYPSGRGETFALTIQFDPITFRQALIQGDSEAFLHYYAERLAYQIERELRTVNLQRFNDEPLRRTH